MKIDELKEIGFEMTPDGLEYQFRMKQLKIVVMPLNTFVLEIHNGDELLNGQRINVNSIEELKTFINFFYFPQTSQN